MQSRVDRKIVAAVFRDRDAAERAVDELREADIPDNRISVVQMHEGAGDDDDDRVTATGEIEQDTKASGVGKGLVTGGALGAIAGFGALFIPGIGPFIAGGALIEALGIAGSAAVTSGVVGAAAGGLTGALVDYGLEREHAELYERRVREGGTLVLVDVSDNLAARAPARSILSAAGGESAESEDEERIVVHDEV